jgi:hypothetical protein
VRLAEHAQLRCPAAPKIIEGAVPRLIRELRPLARTVEVPGATPRWSSRLDSGCLRRARGGALCRRSPRRGLRPESGLLGRHGNVRLSDFGLAGGRCARASECGARSVLCCMVAGALSPPLADLLK